LVAGPATATFADGRKLYLDLNSYIEILRLHTIQLKKGFGRDYRVGEVPVKSVYMIMIDFSNLWKAVDRERSDGLNIMAAKFGSFKACIEIAFEAAFATRTNDKEQVEGLQEEFTEDIEGMLKALGQIQVAFCRHGRTC
jgi:hypothetical protein